MGSRTHSILREWVDDDFPLRARGELSQKPTEEGWWQQLHGSLHLEAPLWIVWKGLHGAEPNLHRLGGALASSQILQPSHPRQVRWTCSRGILLPSSAAQLWRQSSLAGRRVWPSHGADGGDRWVERRIGSWTRRSREWGGDTVQQKGSSGSEWRRMGGACTIVYIVYI